MATRRPRIKPVANILLNSKRKTKQANDVNADVSDVKNSEDKNKEVEVGIPSHEQETANSGSNLLEVRSESAYDTSASASSFNNDKADGKNNNKEVFNLPKEEKGTEQKCEKNNKGVTKVTDSTKNVPTEVKGAICDSEAFKCPPKVGLQRTISHTSNSGLDDVFYSDIEESALHMDLEKSSSNCPISPSKNTSRPRIRPTPHFGQRRNSYVGSSPSPHTSVSDDIPISNSIVSSDVTQTSQTKRERHHSASISGNIHSSIQLHTPHKYFPAGVTNSSMGRIRTESGCSVFSDNNPSSHKLRKIENYKLTARRDFESRFLNGVPEKSVIKMSDLIFYNPTTNPMEQKPIPNVKLEQKDTSSNDVKPILGKQDDDKNTLADDTEAVPVPQLKLNAKGELILDDKSLVIETTAEQEARKALANSSLIYLDEYTGMNGFYSRKTRTRVWPAADTIKFYRCLQNVGTDFSLMLSLFPNRTRRDLKLKFKKEERKNGHLINKALLYPKQFDLETLKQQIEEENLQKEQVKDKKNNSEKKRKKINCGSKATRVLRKSVYQNEDNEEDNNKEKPGDVCQIEKTTHTAPVEINAIKKAELKEPEENVKMEKSKKQTEKLTEVDKLIKRNYDYEKRRKDKYYAIRRRRKQSYFKRKMRKEMTIVKEEIKIENKECHEIEFQDTKQLEMEMDDLLNVDALNAQYNNDMYGNATSNIYNNASHLAQYNKQIGMRSHTVPFPGHANNSSDEEIAKYEHKTIVNLEGGSLNVFSNIKDDLVFITSPPVSPQHSTTSSPAENENNSFELEKTEHEILNNETCSSITSEPELNEAHIQAILTELAEGSLVLVSSLDPDDPDKVLNEIYMVDKNTGDLCDEPLKIPDNIVQCILTVAS